MAVMAIPKYFPSSRFCMEPDTLIQNTFTAQNFLGHEFPSFLKKTHIPNNVQVATEYA